MSIAIACGLVLERWRCCRSRRAQFGKRSADPGDCAKNVATPDGGARITWRRCAVVEDVGGDPDRRDGPCPIPSVELALQGPTAALFKEPTRRSRTDNTSRLLPFRAGFVEIKAGFRSWSTRGDRRNRASSIRRSTTCKSRKPAAACPLTGNQAKPLR